jgi:alanyl-tRNA synthetase
MAETAKVVIATMGEAYPHLADRHDEIIGAILREESQFARTLDAGTVHLEEALIPLTAAERVVGRRPEDLAQGAPVLDGEVAFRLHDTYGFPVDLTVELAAEYGVAVDRIGFERALAGQRDRSRSGKRADLARQANATALYESIARRTGETTFLGYDTLEAEGVLQAIIRDGIEYEELTAVGDEELRSPAGAAAELVFDRTPFYAEGGGQIGDRGVIRTLTGDAVFEVQDAQKPVGGMIVLRGTLRGRVRVGDRLTGAVDAERRAATMRNHTGTHLLHRALRNVVGERARQAGSLVTPDSLRFDYPFDRALSPAEIRAIEDEVRRIIRDDRPVSIAYMSMPQAIEGGADAFFDEKYGETVRTIRVEDYRFELCGGTHCRASGQIGAFVITGERSIGSNARRIEALTGAGADAWLRARRDLVDDAAAALGAQTPEAIRDRIAVLQDELREARRRLRAGATIALPSPGELAARAQPMAGTQLVAFAGAWDSIETLKAAAKDIRGIMPHGVIALALDAEEPQLFISVSDDLVGRGLAAGDLVRAAVAPIDGKGGGRPEMAQGRGTRRTGIPAALEAIRTAVRSALDRTD